jgi:hypothetical protein
MMGLRRVGIDGDKNKTKTNLRSLKTEGMNGAVYSRPKTDLSGEAGRNEWN